MSVLDKLLDAVKLNDDYDEDDFWMMISWMNPMMISG